MPVSHEIYMQRCLQLGALGLGHVAPNPLVGAVLVYQDKIIGEGYHQQYGKAHAEVNAISGIDDDLLSKSTLYVNLEPCVHHGKTPPCVDLIVASKIKTVVIGCIDPFPQVAGKGIEKLKTNGVEVISGICEEACKDFNKRFFTAQECKRPYIILKYAQTMDGYMGKNERSNAGDKMISNTWSQRLVHQWRSEEAGIMVGTRTAIEDNPQLNTRFGGSQNPVRITFDRHYKIPSSHHIFDGKQTTLIFTTIDPKSKFKNVSFIEIDFTNPDFLKNALKILLQKGIQSILVEGGAWLLQQFYNTGLWDESRIFTTPIVFLEGLKAPQMADDYSLIHKEQIDTDTLCIFKNQNPVC